MHRELGTATPRVGYSALQLCIRPAGVASGTMPVLLHQDILSVDTLVLEWHPTPDPVLAYGLEEVHHLNPMMPGQLRFRSDSGTQPLIAQERGGGASPHGYRVHPSKRLRRRSSLSSARCTGCGSNASTEHSGYSRNQ